MPVGPDKEEVGHEEGKAAAGDPRRASGGDGDPGGRGNDLLVDDNSPKNPDAFRCGPGIDEVYYNKGLDKVADDCEHLHPYRY